MKIAFPIEFENRMRTVLGEKYGAFLHALENPSPVSVRINPTKSNFNEPLELPVLWSRFGKYLSKRPIFTLDPLFHGGSYYVQEASSMFLEQAIIQHLPLDQELTVLDLCAAPGGKSTHLLSLLNNQSLLVANEVIRSRNAILRENLQKWGHSNTVITCNDPADFQKVPGLFDAIVVDAPCSGEGLFRKDKNATKEWSPENASLCSARQKRILEDVWPALKQNGFLIYCTCTYNPQENEENLLWLQKNHEVDFLSIKLEDSWGVECVKNHETIGYRFLPHLTQGEGFFLAIAQKKEPGASVKTKRTSSHFMRADKKELAAIENWIKNFNSHKIVQENDLLSFFPLNKSDEIDLLSQRLTITSAGTSVATVKKNKLVPEHGLALSVDLNEKNFPHIAVNMEEALKYLHRDTQNFPDSVKGFNLIQYHGTSLGWANVLDNRINNLYPKEWRIRMDVHTPE